MVPQLWKGAVILLDNYSIHKGENIEKAVREAGAELIYLPPYSPDLSPIENFWSKNQIFAIWEHGLIRL
ncbi:MAG: transposase [Cyanobacteriota bacterium]|nr:transposase [Cyanobacteriota bacterium]